MKPSAFFLMCCVVTCGFATDVIHAQDAAQFTPYESDILSARPVRFILGLGLGAYGYTHGGSFSPSCDCEFSDESGIRPIFFGEVRVQYPKIGIAYGVSVTYYDVSAEFTREETRASVVVGDYPDVDVRYRNTSDVQLRWLSVTPEFFWYLPRSEFFFQAGVELGFPMEATYTHKEIILTEGITYYNGSTENVLLDVEDIPGGSSMRVAASGSFGYDFWLSSHIALTPRMGVSLPLTPVSSSDNSWRVLTGYALLMLNLRI